MIRNTPPEAILITWGKDMLTEGGNTLRAFMREFELLNVPGSGVDYWIQKCKNQPRYMPAHVYIVVCNRILYRANLSHWQDGSSGVEIMKPNGLRAVIFWNRLVITGPVIKAPHKIKFRGFQGFRYTDEIYF